MSRYELELRVDLPSGPGHSLGDALTRRSQEARRAIYRKLGLRAHSQAWVTLDLSAASGRQRLQRLAEECRAARALIGTATVTECLDDAETAAADWFLLRTPVADNSFSLWDDYPCYLPGKLPKGHVSNETFVSAGFVDAYRRLGLAGLSFLRCRNAGRKQAAPWFAALPDHPLGHGLDHPWFDRAAWVRDVGGFPGRRSSSIGTAQYAFHQGWLREDLVGRDPIIGPLLGLFQERSPEEGSTLTGLTVVTVPRYWTRAFPAGDFAYIPWGEDGPNRVGKILRFRQLVVRRRARAALVKAGILPVKALLAVRSVAAPEPRVEPLDEQYAPDPPMYTPQELAALRRREQELFGESG